jgi:hypothetical protein
VNRLYFGYNLQVLSDHLAVESVDFICFAPPFNSKLNDKLSFKSPKAVRKDLI